MNIEATHQNTALSRQCSEAIRIKEVEPGKRIINKEEYHQPGDIEISYAKNDNIEKQKQKKKRQNTENTDHTSSRKDNSDHINNDTNTEIDSLQLKITEFFSNIRNDQSTEAESEESSMTDEEEELQHNTQNMITDARKSCILSKKNGCILYGAIHPTVIIE